MSADVNANLIRGACRACGITLIDIPPPADLPQLPAAPRPWHLRDRETVKFYVSSLTDELKEWLLVMFVGENLELLSVETISRGNVSSVEVDFRKILRRGLVINAAGFLLVHNHPSGDARPSEADIAVTCRLRRVSAELEMPLLDHIIVAGNQLRAIGCPD